MPSVFDGALDAFPTTRATGDVIPASDHNDLADAVNRIEAILGLDSSGPYAATIRERFENLAYKGQSCRVATTGNLAAAYANGTAGVGATLTASPAATLPTIDAQTLAIGDRVLVKNQTAPLQNGIYVVTATASPWQLTRHYDADTPAKLADCKVLVDSGNAHGDTEWYQASTAPTVGTTALYFRRSQPIYGVGNPRSLWTPGYVAGAVQSVMETLPRQLATGTLTPTAGTAFQYLIGGIVCPAGRPVSNVSAIFTGAGTSLTVNWWAVVRQSDRVVMAHTANETVLPTANAARTRALLTAWTPIEDTPVWVVWSVNGNTAPTILTGPAGQAGANLIAPAMAATNGVAPTTTLPTDGTTVITAATAGVASIPYVWLS